MNMVAPNNGKAMLLGWLFKNDGTANYPLKLFLYTNDYTPVDASTIGDFTPASFTGSGTIDILRSEFGSPTIVSNVAYITRAASPSWTCTAGGPQTCYGWCLTDKDGTVAVLAQRFAVPRVMSAGAVETLDPFKIALKTFA